MQEELLEELKRWLLEVVTEHPNTTLCVDDVTTYFNKAGRVDLTELAVLHNIWHSPMMDPLDQDLDELEHMVYGVIESWFDPE